MKVSRRDILAAPAVLTAAAMLGRPVRAEALEETLVIRTTGGAFETALRRNFFDPFSKATGVRVIGVAASDSEMQAKAAAMQTAGHVEWDIISPQVTELQNLSHMLIDLGDCSSLPNVAGAMPGACGRYGMLYLMGAQVMAYDSKAFPGREPQGWKDFWDLDGFPGRRALSNSGAPFANLIAALIADGVPADKIFPLDLDRAFRKLDQIKPHIAVWWRTGDQSQQMWRGSDIAMSLMWSGRAFATKRSGFPLSWTYEDTLADFGAWAILKGCPHPKAARAFLDFYIGSTANDAAFSREMGYATPNLKAAALLTPEEKQDLISTPETFRKIIQMDPTWLEANRAAVLERWNKWVST